MGEQRSLPKEVILKLRLEQKEQAVGGTQQKIPGDVNSMCQRQTEHGLSEAL